MSIREQKNLFTFAVLWMFGSVVVATIHCPPPRPDEMLALFALSVTVTLAPAFGLLAILRHYSR